MGSGERNGYPRGSRTESVSDYYILTGETVVEGPFETHREASQRRADLSTSDVGVIYRIEKR